MPLKQISPIRQKKPNIFEQNAMLEEQMSRQKKEINLPLAILLILVLVVLIAGSIFLYFYYTR